MFEGIQSTSLIILLAKFKAVEKQYYEDPFIYEMGSKELFSSYLPIINRSIWSRAYTVKYNISKVLKSIKENNPEVKVNIISLGAGFDTLYFNLKGNYNNFQYIELDYENITSKKIEKITKSNKLSSIIDLNNTKIEKGDLLSKDYFLFNCDVSNVSKIHEKLSMIPNFDYSAPTIVIAEALLVYLNKESSYTLLKNLTSLFNNLIMLVYDIIGVKEDFGKIIINLLSEKGIQPIRYEGVSDVSSQIERLYNTGFKQVEFYNMLDYYNKFIDPEEIKRIESLEHVDNLEKWNFWQSFSCFGYGLKVEEKYNYLSDAIKINK